MLRGPIQQNDKDELVAVVLLAEAVLQQANLFPAGGHLIFKLTVARIPGGVSSQP